MWKYIIIAILWVWTENYILSKLQITGKKRIVIKIVTLIILVIILYFILSYFNLYTICLYSIYLICNLSIKDRRRCNRRAEAIISLLLFYS